MLPGDEDALEMLAAWPNGALLCVFLWTSVEKVDRFR